jgi:hypothetical protein
VTSAPAQTQTKPSRTISTHGSDSNRSPTIEKSTTATAASAEVLDPLNLARHRRENVTSKQMKIEYPNANKRQLRKYYTKQNELIDRYLGADDEEQLKVEEDARVAPKIAFAVNASFATNFCLFIIQMYAAISTGSLSVNDPYCAAPIFP